LNQIVVWSRVESERQPKATPSKEGKLRMQRMGTNDPKKQPSSKGRGIPQPSLTDCMAVPSLPSKTQRLFGLRTAYDMQNAKIYRQLSDIRRDACYSDSRVGFDPLTLLLPPASCPQPRASPAPSPSPSWRRRWSSRA